MGEHGESHLSDKQQPKSQSVCPERKDVDFWILLNLQLRRLASQESVLTLSPSGCDIPDIPK